MNRTCVGANIHVTHDHNCVARRQLSALSYCQCILHAWCLGLSQALTFFPFHLWPCSGAGASLGIHGVPFQQMMRSIYERFVDEKVEACVQRCREDLFGMTRYSSCVDVRRCAGPEFCDACAGVERVHRPHRSAFCAVPLHVTYRLFSYCCRYTLTTTLINTHIVPFHARYVTFDQEDKGGASTLYRLLPTPQRMAKMVEVLILTKDKQKRGERALLYVCLPAPVRVCGLAP
jgi:hypothetical protein